MSDPAAWPGHSVLQVPVPALEEFVRARTAHYDPAYLGVGPGHVHAHVTALGPFLEDPDDEALALVGKIAAALEPFDFVLDTMATFPDGIIHLRPEPDAGFRELTSRLATAFPQCPPYQGRFGSLAQIQPHLTLDLRTSDVTEASTRALLGDVLPASCRAERLDLAWYQPGRCALRHSWPLGG